MVVVQKRRGASITPTDGPDPTPQRYGPPLSVPSRKKATLKTATERSRAMPTPGDGLTQEDIDFIERRLYSSL